MNEEARNGIKIIVVTSPFYFYENLGDGDYGLQCTENYTLYCNRPRIIFNPDTWVETLYLCKCELMTKEFFSFNGAPAEESTISYDNENKSYVRSHIPSSFTYPPMNIDFLYPHIINQFRTERFNAILKSSGVKVEEVDLPIDCVLSRNGWNNENSNLDKFLLDFPEQRRSSVAGLTEYPTDSVHEEWQVGDTVQLRTEPFEL